MKNLEDIANDWTTLEKGTLNCKAPEFCYSLIKEHIKGRVLELGSADGGMTKLLAKDFEDLTAVDGSQIAIDRLKQSINFDNAKIICSYFETYQATKKFDTIIMGHVLEHVKDPVGILKQYKGYLNNNGKIIIAVPNAKSFHRIAALEMEMIKSIYDLNPTDISIGHRRVYDFELLAKDIENADIKIVKRDGYWLKFLSNAQIESLLTEEIIDVYFKLGREFLDNAAEIIVICA